MIWCIRMRFKDKLVHRGALYNMWRSKGYFQVTDKQRSKMSAHAKQIKIT